MKLSNYFLPTLRQAPGDADNISTKLMFRAALIRKLASGIYEWLPLGFKVLKKVENIVREELDKIGAQEVWLPVIQPKDLWVETGRWGVYGKELLRLKDRKDSEFCFAPTAEEVITNMVRRDVSSHRQLPMTLYQFGTKFRDEIRPRFGVMRAREFYMKDAYSFHASEADCEQYYKTMYAAYERIFKRCGLKFMPVEADSGPIGGNLSHEFMVMAQTGEAQIALC
ncbi:MAG: proline--tRNA ligase, partial [Elusimicrobiales bacterium]|nr:proline--tRNA ligase [Elusimicrobiales bacterium]